jgi:biotin carboxylase/DeoR/GlpR family transcriptional regulator of sugar metabolism
MTDSNQVSLLMPSCPKWSDKARLIRHYFQKMHSVEIEIVNQPSSRDGILIALEKENLALAARQTRIEGCNVKALVLNDPSLYFEMDDKSLCGWRQFASGDASFNEIPTLDMKTASEREAMEFIEACGSVERLMLKPSDEAASVGQAVIATQDTAEILAFLGKSYVAQPFFSEHKILTIDFLAIDGEMKGQHCFYVDGPIENCHWKTGLYQQVLCNATPEIQKEFETIQELTRLLCQKHGLSGIFEIEFLHSHGQTFFLELNLLPGLYGIDEQGLMPLMENIFVPYLQHFDIDIQPRSDFEYAPMGQFYPPSAKSLEHYIQVFGDGMKSLEMHTRPSSACTDDASEDSFEFTTTGSCPDLDHTSTCPSDEISHSKTAMASSSQVCLLMPSCPKWSDKARLIRHYFQKMHDVDIEIVDQPPSHDVILIALEKENLALAARQARVEGCNLKALVLSDPSLYFEMDDKSLCGWRQLTSEDVSFNEIPTLDMRAASEREAMAFIEECSSVGRLMLKPSDEAASVGQAVVSTRDTAEILAFLGKSYVAQPFFSEHKILTIDFLAVDGEVKGQHCFYVDGPIENCHWKTGLYQQVLCNATPEIQKEFETIQELTRHLCQKHDLSGIFEIEFLHSHGQTFFLELNLLPGLYGIDQQGLMPLMESVLVPYLQHFDIDIQPRLDFEYAPEGQFYPPSAKSLEHYVDIYGEPSDTLDRPSSACSNGASEDSSELTTTGSCPEDDHTSTCPSEETSQSKTAITSSSQVCLLMPSCSKWGDKARLIQHYFQKMHDVDIEIVDQPPNHDGILITLEKENLVLTTRQARSDGCNLKALVLNDPSLYFEMDDKSQCGWRQCASEDVSFNEIPTLDMKTASAHEVMQFIEECVSVERIMLKPSDEAASVGQAVVSAQDTSEILAYLGQPYVAQPFFSEHKILTIDFLAIDGEVKGQHCFYVDGPIENCHWKTGLYQQVLCNATPEIRKEFETIQELTRHLCKKHGLNGIFEIEFLHSHGQTFFLELNLLPGLYGIDQQGLMPLMEKILVPYLQHFDIDIQPLLDFKYESMGQFYPPSAKSLEHYMNVYGEGH